MIKKSDKAQYLHVRMSRIYFMALLFLLFTNTALAQNRKPVLRERAYSPKNYNQIQASIQKADRYESSMDYIKAFILYRNLIKTNPDEENVLNGYVRNSVKAKRIKECEIKLKELISERKSDINSYHEKNVMMVESFLGQLFLMTERYMQGNEIIKMINASSLSEKLKYSLKGRMYYEAQSFKNAIAQYVMARKELKDDNIFSKELFFAYKANNFISEATNELVNIFLREDKSLNRNERFDVFSAKHELIKLFEEDTNREVMLQKVEDKTEEEQSLLQLLSELYFMNKDYENSYSVIKNSNTSGNKNSVLISFALKLFKEKQYKNSADFYSLYFTDAKTIQKKDMKQFQIYIDVLIELDELEKCIDLLSEVEIDEAKLNLAYVHHLTGNWERSREMYEKQFDLLKEYPDEFIDYLKLLISLQDYPKTQRVINSALKNSDYHNLRKKVEDQLLYLDLLLSLLRREKNEFKYKYQKLSKDNIISDTDNNIIKIKNDLDLIGDDEKLLGSYLDYLLYQSDPTNKYEEIPGIAENIDDKAKKLFVLKLNYYYLKAEKNVEEQNSIISSILHENPSSSEIGLLVLSHCENIENNTEGRNEILMELLKGEFSDLVKAKARKMIRQK